MFRFLATLLAISTSMNSTGANDNACNYNGIEFKAPGENIGIPEKKVASAAACAVLCRDHPSTLCKAWTWTPSDKKRCWLKRSTLGRQPAKHSDIVSGSLDCDNATNTAEHVTAKSILCKSDLDCDAGFCHDHACFEYSPEGGSCGGFSPPPIVRCGPGLFCDKSANEPGIV